MAGIPDIAVIHLVRACNDLEDLARFIDSYLKFPAGYEHKLIFLLKGFAPELPDGLTVLLNRVPHVRLSCPEGGYDIGSYQHAAAAIAEPLVMFLNSFSVIQDECWLLKLVRAYREDGVGLVGASGSWESLVSTLLVMPNMGAPEHDDSAIRRLKAHLIGAALRLFFPAFPNPHVRTNAFLLAREQFIAMRPPQIRFKLQAWLFESGRGSLTRRILGRGLRVMVVGRDGAAYNMAEWPASRIFWQGQQENLLIHDNRSMAYSRADAAIRAQLCRAAWNCRRD